MFIFIHRRGEVPIVLKELKDYAESHAEDLKDRKESASNLPSNVGSPNVGLGIGINDISSPGYMMDEILSSDRPLVHPSNILKNFRQLLWFWWEYYAHRGRDRLSLELSSHLRFNEFQQIVELLCADNGNECALLDQAGVGKWRNPRSPYDMTARTAEEANLGKKN